ncbi:MAG: corrinoid ABC transporter permease [Melioribacteraceae bacterium]|nr:MAG: corrinoid ABC transporter permease [Melioribacteraceae bacterium]
MWKDDTYFLPVLFLLLIATIFLGLLSGSVTITPSEIFKVISGTSQNSTAQGIILDIRLPRVLLALAIGGGLSVVGAVFQAILRNPLAEPYILGISSGGTFGAVLSFLLGLSLVGTQIFAFTGAFLVVILVYSLGKRFGELDPNTLLLSGVMIGAFFSAAILLMMTMLDHSLRNAVFWLIGNISLATPGSVYYILPVSIIVSLLLALNSHKYNLITLGSEEAKHLGLDTGRLKAITYISGSLLIGAVVSVSGIIGFVGLLVPHVCRMLFGLDNRKTIPASFFVGGIYLILADTIGRTIISPAEIPVGAVTALIGAPVFIYLLKRKIYHGVI